MPLRERVVSVDYLAKEGRVEPNSFLLKKEADRADQAQMNMHDNNKSYYTSGNKNREISYSYTLSQLYGNLQFFYENALNDQNLTDTENLTEEALKNFQKFNNTIQQFSLMSKNTIKEIYPQILAMEYPNATAAFSERKIDAKTPGDPKKVQLSAKQLASLETLSTVIGTMNDWAKMYYTNSLKGFDVVANYDDVYKEQKKIENRQLHTVVPNLKKFNDILAQKTNGKVIRQSNAEIMETLRRSIGKYLIRDDSSSSISIDREKAEKDIANKLSAFGLQLVVRKVKKQTPEEELISQTQTSVLRAAWDGYIAQPKSARACSETLKELVNLRGRKEFNNLPTTEEEKYDLSQSKVWETCQEMAVFKPIEKDLRKGLSQIHYPADKLKDLTYQDIAWLVNDSHSPNADEVKARQENGLSDINGYMLASSGKKVFYQEFIKNHKADLRDLLAKQDYPKAFINSAIKKMETGKTVTDADGNEVFNAHHNNPINDPDYFERTHTDTKQKWTDMNNPEHIVLMDKDVHNALHSTENNVTSNGYIAEDAGESNRTIFTDNKTKEQFYYLIQVADGIDAVTGFNNEIIYNRQYLDKHTFENGIIASMDASNREVRKAKQEMEQKQKNEQKQTQNSENSAYAKNVQHVKARIADVSARKNADNNQSFKPASNEKKVKKEYSQIRPDYKGLGNHGASSSLGNRRGRSK